MSRTRIRIGVVTVPALLIGALVGGWLGGALLRPPGSTADGPAVAGPRQPIVVRLETPSGAAADPSGVAVLSTPAPSSAAAQRSAAPGQPPGGSQPGGSEPGGSQPGGGQPGNPGGGNNPQPQPTAATTSPAAPQPVWGQQLEFSIQVVAYYPTGSSVQVGRAQGWFQMHNDRKTFRYSFTFCRQSSYMLPNMTVAVNGHYVGQTWQSTLITTINPSYSGNSSAQPCYGSTATVSNEHTYPTIQNVYFKLQGSTFNGSEHVVASQDRTLY